jgi:hypothetical protein
MGALSCFSTKPWLTSAMRPALIALGIRTSVLGLSALAFTLIEPRSGLSPLAIWNRWDGPWYIAIAQHGYIFSPTGQSSVNFFPLFPALIWLCSQPFIALGYSAPYLAVAMAISWSAFAVASVLIHDITKRRYGPSVATTAVLILGVYPFGFYFGAPYSESLFLCLALAAFCFVERRQWWGASLAALLAGAARPSGIVVWICVMIAYGLAWRRSRQRIHRDLIAVAAAPLGTAAYAAYCWVSFGDSFAYFATAEAGWGHGHVALDGVLEVVHNWLTPTTWIVTGSDVVVVRSIYSGLLTLFLILIVTNWRRLGLVYAVYSLASIALPLFSSETLVSTGRYGSVAFPVFMVLARYLQPHPSLRDLILIVCTLFLSLFSVLFCFNLPVY